MASKLITVAAAWIMGVYGMAVQARPPSPPNQGPQGIQRNAASNDKDLVFAACLAKAYQDQPAASADIRRSIEVLRGRSQAKAGKSTDALIDRYLQRDYYHPLADAEVKGIRFDFLKCLDLYHAKVLDTQASDFVRRRKGTGQPDR